MSWVLNVHRSRASALARLYPLPSVSAAEAAELVWVRGQGGDEELARVMTLVPQGRFFTLVPPDRLRPHGKMVPTARLPDLRWEDLRRWLSVRVPHAAMAGPTPAAAALRLVPGVRTDVPEEMLLCAVDTLSSWARHAPIHRLTPLSFVTADDARALVRGAPLPSIPGERFVVGERIATPAGFVWRPAVAPQVLQSWLGLSESSIALLFRDGSIAELRESLFAPVTRRYEGPRKGRSLDYEGP